MQAFIEELQTDNVNLENKLTKKQGAIEYLERHETTTSPAALIQTQAPWNKTKPLPDPDKFTDFKSTIPFD